MARVETVRVAGASLNQTPLDWEGNKKRIIKAIKLAKAQHVSVLCLPELCISGYGCEDMFHAVHVHETSIRVLNEILPFTDKIIVALSMPLSFRGGVYNVAAVVANREILGFTAKQHLPSEGVHYEPRWFKRWPADQRVEITQMGKQYPLGDILYDIGGLRIGFEICQDAWVAKRTGVSLSERGVDILLNPSASHFAFGKFQVRKRFIKEACRAFGVGYIYTNTLGNGSGCTIYDGETLIGAGEKLLVQGPRFSFEEVKLSVADINIADLRMDRARSSSIGNAPIEKSDLEVRVDYTFPDALPPLPEATVATWEESEFLKEEEFTRAVSLGLFDYMRKSVSKGFVISLSGGADSSSAACMVYAMVKLMFAELGMDKIKQALPYYKELESIDNEADLMKAMLLCLYQRSAYSSDVTEGASRALAKAINASFVQYDIRPMVDAYTAEMADVIGRELTWEADDLALQNIQARVRGPGAWLLANVRDAILLATSNRSEASVGYTTMDGDTCGGLSPIGGIDKDYLRQWLRWFEKEGPEGVGAISVLKQVNDQEPTAELRPGSAKQTDETDLMPYSLLDGIERLAIGNKRSPLEVFKALQGKHEDIDDPTLGGYVARFFRLWAHNQWKRERYAPAFHVDDQSVDPKTWCRFPILSGSFERELQELEQHLAHL